MRLMGCGKNPYPSREQAQRKANARMREGEEGLRVYHCRSCQAWHMTSQPDSGFVGTPTDSEVDEALLRWLRRVAGTKRHARPTTPVPVADLERWRPSLIKVNAHARSVSLQRLVAQGKVRLDSTDPQQPHVAWVLPSDEEIDAQVLHSLRRALLSRQHGNPLVVLDLEWWVREWASPVQDLEEDLRRASVERLAACGAIYVEDLGTPRARVIAVA